MRKRFTFLIAVIAMLVFLIPLTGWGQTATKTEGFETATAGTIYNSTQDYNAQQSDCGIGWTMYYGTVSTNDKLIGAKSAQMRWYSSATNDLPYIRSTIPVDGLTKVGFRAKVGNTNVKMVVQYSANGSSWTTIEGASAVTFSSTNSEVFEYDIPSGGKFIKIAVSSSSTAPSSSNYKFIVDSVAFTYSTSLPSITANDVDIDADATSGSITYQINNGTSSAMVTAQVQSGGTIANLAIDNENITTTSVPFTCDANTANTAKTATVRLTYGNVTKDVTITQARYVPQVSGYTIDFEYETESYVDWTFSNIVSKLSGTGNPNTIQAHGGSYYASTGGYGSASITTASVIANPGTLTCYITKTTGNTTSSTWKIQVKTAEANNWTDVKSQDATSMEQGTWDEFTADLSDYSNVYVRVSYGGSTAVRNIDDLSLTMASTDPSITAANVDIAYDAENGSIAYTIKNTPNPAGTLTATIAQSPASTIEGLTIGTINGSTVAFTCNANNTTTAHTATVTLTYTYGDNQTTTKDVVITQAAHPTPSINADDVNINGDATDGSITYTIDNSITGGVLTASTVATWLTPGVVTNEAVPFTCEANQGAERSATVVLTYTYNTNQTVTKNVTVTQAKAPYTTIPALFAAATSTNKTVDVEFNNWVVSGVSTNGKNVFVTDNQGNGFVINSSTDQSGTYAVGNILSGKASSCTLKLNNGYAQLTNVSGLTINTGGTVSVANIAMEDLSGVHTGALVSYTNLTSSIDDSGQTTKYYLSDGNTTIQIYGSLYAFGSTIEAGKKYDITGIYQQYSNTKEVLPRSAADIVLKAQMTAPSFNAFTYAVGETPTAQPAAIAGTDFTGDLTVTVAEGEYVISNDGSNYGTSATFTQSSGTISSQTLYVKLNPNLSEGTYNGRLLFTANYLDAFEVNLAGSVTANPTYNVVLTQPTGGIATIASDPAYAQSGTTITLSYSDVDDCYEFSSWSVMWEDTEMHEITLDANNQFEMPAAEVYVSAVFSQKKFTVDYSVNGSIREALQDVVDCGDEAYMWDEDGMEDEGVTMPTGYEFAGWSTSTNSTETVASFEPTANTTLYAVLVPKGVSLDYVKVTEDLDDWSGEYLIVYEDSENGNKALNGGLNTMDASGNTIPVSISTISGNSVIESNNTTDAARVIIASKTNGYSIKSASNLYIGHSGSNNTLNTSANDEYTNTISLDGSVSIKCGTYYLRYNKTSGQERFRYYTSGQQDIQLYKRQTATQYTYIVDVTTTDASLPSIEPTYIITVKNGGVLTLTGANNGDETNLVIEDGGQLICNKAVQATVQKSVEKWVIETNDGENLTDGWYTIASPVNGISTEYFALNTADLFSYDEETIHWWNAKNTTDGHDFNTLNRGQGYLYANSTDQTLEFAGTMIASNTTVTVPLSYKCTNSNYVGYNLVGNPFTRNLTSSDVIKVGDNDLGTYLIVEGGNQLVVRDISANEIKPGRGFFVQATGENQDIVFNYSSKRGESNNKPSFIRIDAGNDGFMDRAYIQFGNVNTLRKFTLNDNTPKVYVMNNNLDWAATVINETVGEMPVCFKAVTDGQYTISVKPEGVEVSYLHLIDNIAGTDIDLLATPSYTFNAKGDDYESRFRLVFSANMTNAEMGEDFAFMSDGQLVIANEGEATLQVIDVTGRVVATENINGTCSKAIKAKAGVYVLRLVNGTDVKTQKIVIR